MILSSGMWDWRERERQSRGFFTDLPDLGVAMVEELD